MTLSELPLNPFEDNIVFEPRDAEEAVRGLNEGSLVALLRQFARLEGEVPPRRQPLRLKAQLVTSAEPGYGKSHLIGRLFGALRDRATLVYLRPFQDPGASWRSILLKVVQELDRPKTWQPGSGRAEEPTHLDAFACGVMALLLARLITRGKVVGEYAAELTATLRADPLGAFGYEQPHHYLRAWVRDQFGDVLRAPLLGELRGSGLGLNAPASAWLKVLHAYAFGAGGGDQREACLDWIKGENISEEERALVGLDGTELPVVEESALKRNADAFARLQDLLALAGFYRPFLFCFDQTELFTGNAELAAEFGAVIDQLVSFGLNHLVVVTANLEPWTGVILPSLQTAYRDRFSDPLQLQGITRPQALALARQRLTGCGLGEAEITRFVAEEWLGEVFRDVPAQGVRTFLRRCARRCAQLSENRGVVVPERTLIDYYSHYEAEVRARPNRLDFEPDILRWSVGKETVGDALAGFAVERFADQKQYFPICWKGEERRLLLGLEDSSSAMRWRSILRAASQQVTHGAHQGLDTRVLFLRTPAQRPIPGAGWKVIGQEMERAGPAFALHVIGAEDLLTICASYELYANVMEGNTPFRQEEMLTLVREKLAPWWQRLLAAPRPEKTGPAVEKKIGAVDADADAALSGEIRKVVSTKLFLSLDQLLNSLETKLDPAAVLARCRTVPEIRVFATSQATALKWQSSPSASAS